jgi:transketolase N-terminal domain/subunit
MSYTTDYLQLEALARKVRWLAISAVAGRGAGQVGGPFSAIDIIRCQEYEEKITHAKTANRLNG